MDKCLPECTTLFHASKCPRYAADITERDARRTLEQLGSIAAHLQMIALTLMFIAAAIVVALFMPR